MYDNLIKFCSVFPFFQLVPGAHEGANKASFKERCNLLREFFKNLYEGLKLDEAVAFHSHLMQSYFECLTFILLKRVQPFWQSANEEERQFLVSSLNKVVSTPLRDYL